MLAAASASTVPVHSCAACSVKYARSAPTSIANFTLQAAQEWTGTVLALAAASMIYVAVADLIPGLHKRPELGATAQQVALIALGVALIWLVGDVVRAA